MNIIVLKTNIKLKREVKSLAPVLDDEKGIVRWNIALDDIDKVLRVETESLAVDEIIEKVAALGFMCEELTD